MKRMSSPNRILTKPTLWRELRFWWRVLWLPSVESRKIAVELYLIDRRRQRLPQYRVLVFSAPRNQRKKQKEQAA